jgi:predicted polysaccharide biosynthesis protein
MNIRKIFQAKENRVLGENIFSLGLLNIVNYIFPLLIIPHLTRTLGRENYGLYAFATVVVGYIALFIRYGFDLSVTKEIALVRTDHEAVRRIFWRAIGARMILCCLGSVVLGILVLVAPQMREHALLFCCGILLLVDMVLMPTWLFQGMETMKIIAILNFLMKGSSFFLIVFLVKHQDECVWAFFLYCISFFLGGILGFIIAVWKFSLWPMWIPFPEILKMLYDGWHVFAACIGSSFCREGYVVVIGFTTNYQVVGYYFAASKCIGAVQSLCNIPIMQGLYPYMSRKLSTTGRTEGGTRIYRLIGIAYAFFMLLVTISCFAVSGWFITWYLGAEYAPVIIDVRILSPIILISGLNYYCGIVGLINLGYQKEFAKFVWISGAVGIMFCVVLSYFYQDQGAAWAMLLSELILLAFVGNMLYKITNSNHRKLIGSE